MRTLDDLIAAIRREAERAEFPIDRPVYEQAKKDPLDPILFAGTLSATTCVFGRDLGKDEVAAGEPLIGAGGRLVRSGVYEASTGHPPDRSDKKLESALALVVLTNTVPYKPPGNKAYTEGVKSRFRPLIAEFLVDHWRGNRLLSLGTEAFRWFAPFAEDSAAFDAFWAREDRYEAEIRVSVRVAADDLTSPPRSKTITLAPLPHPSPLNQRWFGLFPGLLAARLAAVEPESSEAKRR